MKIFRNKITQLRKAKKLTVNQVAFHLGKCRSTISYWEHGKRFPEKTDIIALAMLLGVSVAEISEYEDLPDINQTKEKKIGLKELTAELESMLAASSDITGENIKSLNKILNETNRVISENKILKKENGRLEAQNRSINEILYIKDKNRIIRGLNNNFLFYIGKDYTKEDVIGLKAIDIYGRKEIEDIVPLENRVFETGESIKDIKIKIPGKGKTKYGLMSIEPIFEELENVVEIAVSIKDITEVVENVAKLELLETVINKLDEQIWIMNETTHKYNFFGGSGTEKMYGHTKEEFRNDPFLWFGLIHPEVRQKYQATKNLHTFPLGEHLIRFVHKNGSNKRIKYKAFRTYDNNNKPILYGIISDITKELETKNIIALMEKSINSMKQAFCMLRPSTSEHLFVNRAREQIYGYSYDKFLNNGYEFWLNTCLHPDDREREEKYNNKKSWPDIREFKIIRPNGEIRRIEARVTKIVHEGEEFFSFIDRDITKDNKVKERNQIKKQKQDLS